MNNNTFIASDQNFKITFFTKKFQISQKLVLTH